MKNFEFITNIDVHHLNNQLEAKPFLWQDITLRQDTPGSPHKYTRTVFVRWAKELTVHAAFNDLEPINYLPLTELPAIVPIVDDLMQAVGAKKLGRVLIVEFEPGGKITPHSDEGNYADTYERFHIPLKSEPGNEFYCGEDLVWMQPGQLWWFNHKEFHKLENKSDKPRVHLIVDVLAPEYKRERPREYYPL